MTFYARKVDAGRNYYLLTYRSNEMDDTIDYLNEKEAKEMLHPELFSALAEGIPIECVLVSKAMAGQLEMLLPG